MAFQGRADGGTGFRRRIDGRMAQTWASFNRGTCVGFLKRLLGGDTRSAAGESAPFDPAAAEADERQHELDVLRSEQERLGELAQRQLRYEKYAWQPPAQGGERRADDRDKGQEG